MNNADRNSALTPSQRRHLEQEYGELEKIYDSLTSSISALDTDISKTLDAFHRQPLEKTRAERAAERDKVVIRMKQIEAQLGSNVVQPGQQRLPPITPAPSPQVSAPDDARNRTLRVPIWIWYFVVVLIGFVLGVVTDLAQLFDLSSCTALWLATALALISGVVILGFSWLPDQRSLHDQKDRIILVVLILVVTIVLATYASTTCATPTPPVAVALKTSHDTYVTAWNGEGDRDWKLWGWTDHPDVDDWERFVLLCYEDDKAALLTYHNRYVTAMDADGDWILRAEGREIELSEALELFTLIDGKSGKPLPCSKVARHLMQNEVSVIFATVHDRYVTARNGKDDGDWRIWADEPGPIRADQVFTLIKQN